jgi:preprotein translocase subunit Sec63
MLPICPANAWRSQERVIRYRVWYNMLTTYKVVAWFSVKAYNASKNYYRVLNIPETASQQDVKKAFRTLAKKCHPDSAKGREEEFKEINEAYQVLSDTSVKQEYDQVRSANSPHSQPNRQSQDYS